MVRRDGPRDGEINTRTFRAPGELRGGGERRMSAHAVMTDFVRARVPIGNTLKRSGISSFYDNLSSQ